MRILCFLLFFTLFCPSIYSSQPPLVSDGMVEIPSNQPNTNKPDDMRVDLNGYTIEELRLELTKLEASQNKFNNADGVVDAELIKLKQRYVTGALVTSWLGKVVGTLDDFALALITAFAVDPNWNYAIVGVSLLARGSNYISDKLSAAAKDIEEKLTARKLVIYKQYQKVKLRIDFLEKVQVATLQSQTVTSLIQNQPMQVHNYLQTNQKGALVNRRMAGPQLRAAPLRAESEKVNELSVNYDESSIEDLKKIKDQLSSQLDRFDREKDREDTVLLLQKIFYLKGANIIGVSTKIAGVLSDGVLALKTALGLPSYINYILASFSALTRAAVHIGEYMREESIKCDAEIAERRKALNKELQAVKLRLKLLEANKVGYQAAAAKSPVIPKSTKKKTKVKVLKGPKPKKIPGGEVSKDKQAL